MILKFRVWLPDKDVERMLRVKALVFEKDRTRCVCGYSFDFSLEDENATIMQSTGLCDKVGTEVFEGDILEVIDEHSWLEVVSYSQDKAMFVTEEINREFKVPESPLYDLFDTNIFKFKVIGNIYENPELLEVKE